MGLTKEEKQEMIQKNKASKGKILSVLLDLQRASPEGYIDEETTRLVAEELGMSETRVYEIASYYAMLEVKPQAVHVLEVCNSSPCHFSKAEEVVRMVKKHLDVELGGSTADGLFALQYTPCVGACDIGPVIKVRDEVCGDLTEEKIVGLIEALRADKSCGKEDCSCKTKCS